MSLKENERVVVVGCGPVGMVLTLALYRKGIPVTLLERADAPIEDQRAAAIQPSSLEMLAALGVTGEVHDRGGAILAHKNYSFERIVGSMFITTDGVFGMLAGISATYIFLFILFGAMLRAAASRPSGVKVASVL